MLPKAGATPYAMTDELKFDPDRGIVWRGGERLTIEPKGVEVLAVLARDPGATVSAEQLQQEVWRRKHLGEGVISQTIYKLRRALADQALIQSVRGRGWRLTRPIDLADASRAADETVPTPTSDMASHVNPGDPTGVANGALPRPSWSQWIVIGLFVIPVLAFLLGRTFWLQPSMGPEAPVIAVLQFMDESPEQNLKLQATAFRERLAIDILGISPYRVVSDELVARFRGDAQDESQVLAQMGANVVLHGKLEPLVGSDQGFALSIVMDDHSGNGLGFARRYEHGVGDIAPLLERVRIDLYEQFNRSERLAPDAPHGTRHTEAWVAFTRAASLASANSPDSHRRAIASLELAVELDPNFAEAWAELGGLLGSRLFAPDDATELKSGRKRSLAFMDRAIELSPDYVDAILMRSELRNIYAFDWAGASADVALAEKIVGGPRVDVWLQKARLAAALGDLEGAVRIGDEAHAMSPNSGARRNAGWHLLALGRYQQARSYLLDEHRKRPWESSLNFYLGLCDVFEGLPRDGLKRFQYADSDYRLTGIAIAQFELEDQIEAERALSTLIARMPDQAAYEIASVYGHIGNADEAFLWLDRAFEVGDGALEYLAYDPRFRKLRDDPRMHERLRRLRHPKWVDEHQVGAKLGV
ncbi:MAG TPA: winged helix-turn-helix domain-containing protein [Pseudomonadota bacterium]|nr:winged helix-turn-helix domain-containing protein [Pseudomonadota bacterium]